jgi:hypothetical protein
MTENVSQSAEDRILRMMADQCSQLEAIRENFSSRITALERRPRRSLSGLLDLDFESLASIALLVIGALILTRVAIYALAQMKRRGVADDGQSLPQA